jgi:RimJ/RimL family protein N-acetyltransferase
MSQPRLFLQTERLHLREFTMDDGERIVELDADPEVMRYVSFGAPTPRATILQKVLPAWIQQTGRRDGTGFWAAEDSTNCFVGWFHLRVDRFEAAEYEVGYRLRRECWGQGYATEGARAVIEHGFRVSRFPKITARTLVGNLRSQRVMQKCGLEFESHFVYPEYMLRGGTVEERRAVKYSAMREEWERWAAASLPTRDV